MTTGAQVAYEPSSTQQKNAWVNWLIVASMIYLLLLAVSMIGSGFKGATGGQAKELFEFASNPFMGLIIGTVATALIQSSSTVTSIIVGLVAGGMPVTIAIPMIMGANIGTTITNTLVSLGHVRNKEEFKRAFSAATVHDFFNLVSVIIFLPLELFFHPLEKASAWLSQMVAGGSSMSMKSLNFIKPITKPVVGMVQDTFAFLPAPYPHVLLIIVGIAAIFISISIIGKQLKSLMVGRAKQILHNSIGRGPVSGIASGTAMTVLVQSSSTTTSLMVPLVGSGIFKMRDIYPFTLGANIGTCITALLAATAVSGGNSVFAMQIAIVHLLYNTLGVVFIYGIPPLREIAPTMAEKLAELAAENKLIALAYIVSVFFVFPGVMIFITQ